MVTFPCKSIMSVFLYEIAKSETIVVVFPLFLLGFSSAAFIYADRFFQSFENDAAFILASTISTQSVSIVCGALVMVVFPRLALSFRDNKSGFSKQWTLLNRFVFLTVLTARYLIWR